MNYSVVNKLAGFALAAFMTVGMTSCELLFGDEDNPVNNQTEEAGIVITPTATGANVKVTSLANLAEAITSLKDQIAAKGSEEFVIDIDASGLESTSEVNEITVPLTDGSNVKLNFTNSISTSEPLTVKSESTIPEPKEAKNKLTIVLPANTEAAAIDLNINMPETTVTLESADGSNVYLKNVSDNTALNTLILGSHVFANTLEIAYTKSKQNINFAIEGDKTMNTIFMTPTQFADCDINFVIKTGTTGTPVITLKDCWWTRSDVFHGQFKMEEGCNIEGLKFVIDGGWYGAGKTSSFAADVDMFIKRSGEYRGDALSVPVTIVINNKTYTAPANSKTLTEVTE